MRRILQISRGLIILNICFFVSGCSVADVSSKLNNLDDKVGNVFNEFQEEQVDKTVYVMDDKVNKKEGLTSAEKESIDKWLEENNLNRYGDPIETFYIGGTPLFNEETGENFDRYEYILKNHPDLLEKIK